MLFHQITAHHFFQSESSAYRVDPAVLIQFFNLQPRVDYKVPTKEYKWRSLAYVSISEERCNKFERDSQGDLDVWGQLKWNAEDCGDYIFYERKREDRIFNEYEYGIYIKDMNHSYKEIKHQDVHYGVFPKVQCFQYKDVIRTSIKLA